MNHFEWEGERTEHLYHVRQNVGYHSLIEFFFRIAHPDLPYKERVRKILTARGFLLGQSSRETYLIENSVLSRGQVLTETDYLDELLRKYEVGSIEVQRVILREEKDNAVLTELFLEKGRCGGFDYSYYAWEDCLRREHGQRTPVYLLDPFIARLIKIISTLGIVTNFSCDGHGRNHAAIAFGGKYNTAWFQILHRAVGQKISFHSDWILEGEWVHIVNHNNVVELYLELQEVAEILYSNRSVIRRARKKCLDSFQEKDVEGLSVKELQNLFWEKGIEGLTGLQVPPKTGNC